MSSSWIGVEQLRIPPSLIGRIGSATASQNTCSMVIGQARTRRSACSTYSASWLRQHVLVTRKR